MKQKCPVCKKEIYLDHKRHIVQVARFEVWQKAIGCEKETPHFDYYFKNTNSKLANSRTWKI